ncbi:MAG: hypothetical protein RRB13_05665 [bacterium]|nr:hypothetical protein [bacterium]
MLAALSASLALVPWWMAPLPFPAQLALAWLGYWGLHRFGHPARFWLWWVLGFATLGFRWAQPAIQADDYLRYLFDGQLVLQGVNPYGLVPQDLPLYQTFWTPKGNIPTIYPPLAEGIFTVAAWIALGLPGLRLLSALALMFLMPLAFWAWPKAKAQRFLLLVLYCPLVQQELFHSAHVDVWLLPLLFGWYLLAKGKRSVAAGGVLGLAVLLKLSPLVLFPLWAVGISLRQRWWAALGLCGVLALGFGLFYPQQPFSALALFYQSIEGYSPFYRLLRWGLDRETARLALASLGTAGYLIWLARNPQLDHLFWVFAGLFLFTPTGFPWYLAPLLLVPKVGWPSWWVLFCALAHLQYYLLWPYGWALELGLLAFGWFQTLYPQRSSA